MRNRKLSVQFQRLSMKDCLHSHQCRNETVFYFYISVFYFSHFPFWEWKLGWSSLSFFKRKNKAIRVGVFPAIRVTSPTIFLLTMLTDYLQSNHVKYSINFRVRESHPSIENGLKELVLKEIIISIPFSEIISPWYLSCERNVIVYREFVSHDQINPHKILLNLIEFLHVDVHCMQSSLLRLSWKICMQLQFMIKAPLLHTFIRALSFSLSHSLLLFFY